MIALCKDYCDLSTKWGLIDFLLIFVLMFTKGWMHGMVAHFWCHIDDFFKVFFVSMPTMHNISLNLAIEI